MAKITPIVVDVTNGENAATYINEAIKNVEVDGSTIMGDGINTPLSSAWTQNIPISWLKIASLLDADPLAGNIAFNNADLSLCTEIYLSNTSHQPMNVSKMLTNSEGSGILIQQKNDDSKFIIFLTKSVTDNTTYHKFVVSEYDSGVIFDDGAELITTYTAAISTGGGHTIQDKNGNTFTQEDILQFMGKVLSVTGKTQLVQRFDDAEDVDTVGVQVGDIPQQNATNDGLVMQSTAPNLNVLPSSEVINANGILNTSLEHGYSFFRIVAKNSTGSDCTISIGSTASGTDIINAQVAVANADTSLLIAKDFFDIDNDTDLYVTSDDITGTITLYFTPIIVR